MIQKTNSHKDLIFTGELPPMGYNEALDFFCEELDWALTRRGYDFSDDGYTIIDTKTGAVLWISNGEESVTIGRWPNIETAREEGRAGVKPPASFRARIWRSYLRWKDRWATGGMHDNTQKVLRSAMSLRMGNDPNKWEVK